MWKVVAGLPKEVAGSVCKRRGSVCSGSGFVSSIDPCIDDDASIQRSLAHTGMCSHGDVVFKLDIFGVGTKSESTAHRGLPFPSPNATHTHQRPSARSS